jgi:hypothetical protein
MGMDRDDLELFSRSVEHAMSAASVDAALDELGWREALEDDPRAAVSVLFEQQGRANVRSSALDWLLAHALGVEEGPVVWPALGEWAPPGELRDDRFDVRGLAMGSEPTVVVAVKDGKHVAVTGSGLATRDVHGMDSRLGIFEVTGTASATELGPVDWQAAVSVAQRAVGHELVGASRRMLELAREHALERIQFGRPIAMFQAIRHRLAETYLAIETADAALDGAWLDPNPVMSAMAKATAGRSARTVARHCQQVLAGIGFTTEHDLHHYIRRVFLLDELFGASRVLTRQLGEELLRTKQLPPLLPL